MTSLLVVAVAAIATSLAYPGSAFAVRLRLAGATCRPLGESNWSGTQYGRNVEFENSVGDTMQVTCPLVRDLPTADFTSVLLHYDFPSTSTCSIVSVSSLGSSWDFDQNSASSAATSTSWSSTDVSHYSNGYYALHCVVPDDGKIIGYYLLE